MNPALVDFVGADFDFTAAYNGGGSTPPTLATASARGGVIRIDTSATAARTSHVVFQGFGAYSVPKTTRIYFLAHALIRDLGDALSLHEMGISVGGTGGIHDQTAGLGFSMANGVMNLELRNAGVSTIVPTTWTPETTLYHDFAFAFDLTTITAYVDDVAVGSTSVLTNFPPGAPSPCGFMARTSNGATAASRSMDLDVIRTYFERP